MIGEADAAVRARTILLALAGLVLHLAAAPASHAGEYRSLSDGLEATLYVPDSLASSPALVVALHGCNQQAEDHDDETGWTALADEAGFLLLLPEQRVTHNPARCFNWMLPEHRERGRGEPAAIMDLVEEAAGHYPVDTSRVFVTGLSAGGAMAAVLLATYPERFAAGAVIAGLPYRCVTTQTTMASVRAATVCMSQGNRLVGDAQEWARRVRAASDYAGERWPRVSIWYGSDDDVVNPVNALDLMRQWTAVHDADQEPDAVEDTERWLHRVYHDAQGRAVVEVWEVKNLGHAMPIDEDAGCGVERGGGFRAWFLPGWGEDYVEDVGLCASRRIARFWGLL